MMTYTNAQAYVARILGNAGNTNETTVIAADAIKAAIQEWNLRHDWRYLLMNTGDGFTVAACTLTGTSLTTTTPNGFAAVNINQTATGATIGTVTVTAVVSTTTLTISGGTNGGPETLTFSADIPIRATVSTYFLPTPIKRPHSVRLLTNEREVLWKEEREIKRQFADIASGGTPIWYNTFNQSNWSTGRQNGVARFFPIPSQIDTARVWYYRPIAEPSTGTDNLDVPDRYIYSLLEMARAYYLKGKDADNPRTAMTWQNAEKVFARCVADDEQGSEDRDIAMVPLMEWGFHRQVETDDVIFGGSL